MTDCTQERVSPEAAVAWLESMHTSAVAALRAALARFVRDGVPPDAEAVSTVVATVMAGVAVSQ